VKTRKSLSHEQAIELLPWLLTGAMDEQERELVREHARSCVFCRRDLEELELINELISNAAKAQPIPAPDMRSINARIDEWEHRKGRVKRLIRRLGLRFQNPWRLAFAAQSVLVVVLAAVLLWPAGQVGEFETLTAPRNLPAGQYIRVVFSDDLSGSELTSLLDEMALAVTDGPSDRGVYTLSVAQPLSADERDNLFLSLQQNPDVVFAQWLARPENP
jgi:hypothetical protein